MAKKDKSSKRKVRESESAAEDLPHQDMGTLNLLKKLKRRKKADRRRGEVVAMGCSELAQQGEDSFRGNKEAKEQHNKTKKVLRGVAQSDSLIFGLQKNRKKVKSKKRRNDKVKSIRVEDIDTPSNEVEAIDEKEVESELEENYFQKSRRKKSKNAVSVTDGKVSNEEVDAAEQQNGKSKKSRKTKRKMKAELVENRVSPDYLVEIRAEDAEDEVYLMSSGDEDYSKGMKKWITEYHQSRPGIKLLQEKIDDFIEAHEAEEEKAREEREAQAAEGGWTVVLQHKGRKKTKDAESGIVVGSVAQAAIQNNMAKKKKDEVGIDIYRFQKREAHRNEIAMLQSKFEQDKKRIQQLRAARKFRPY